jgi:RNA polymerase sigma-70 factor (ECF subfamily)
LLKTHGPVEFEKLLADNRDSIWTLCRRMMGREDLARDAFQDCCIRVWQGLKDFRGEAKPSSWIWRIAYRSCLELLRREGRHQVEDLDAHSEGIGDRGRDQARKLEEEDARAFLLAALNPRQRALIHLYYTEEFSCEEIAEHLEIGLSSVKVGLHRARQAMSRHWDQAHGRKRV